MENIPLKENRDNDAEQSDPKVQAEGSNKGNKILIGVLVFLVVTAGASILYWNADNEAVIVTPTLSSFDGWDIELPDRELLSTATDAPNIIYSTIEGTIVSVVRKNTKSGQEEVIYAYQAYIIDQDQSSSRTEPTIVSGLSPDISSDGKKIVYVDNEGLKIYEFVKNQSASLIKIIEPVILEDLMPPVPPVWSEPGLIGAYSLSKPRWSPDGRLISLVTGGPEGVINGVFDTETNSFLLVSGGTSSDYSWSPVGNKLGISGPPNAPYNEAGLFISQDQDVTKTVNILEADADVFIGSESVSYSPGGQKIVAVVKEIIYNAENYQSSGTEKVMVLNVDGSAPVVVSSRQVDNPYSLSFVIAPFFSVDGKSVYFGDEKDGRIILFSYGLDNQQILQIGALPDFNKIKHIWTPQGYLALIGESGRAGERVFRIFVLDLNKSELMYSSAIDEEPLELLESE